MASHSVQHGSTQTDGTVASRFDPETPHPARIYNYWLGGKDHFRADRRAAEAVIRHRPEVVAGARANRAFLARTEPQLRDNYRMRQPLTGLRRLDDLDAVVEQEKARGSQAP